MKIFLKLFKVFILPLVIMAGVPFFIKGPDNKPLMSWDKLTGSFVDLPELSNAENIGENIRKKVASVVSSSSGKKMKTYKWKDKKGVWHFSDKKNRNGSSETIYVESIENTVKFDPKIESENTGRTKTENLVKASAGKKNNLSPVSPYTQIPELFKQALDINEKFEKRYIENDKILNGR